MLSVKHRHLERLWRYECRGYEMSLSWARPQTTRLLPTTTLPLS
jgi:hypothetical protein